MNIEIRSDRRVSAVLVDCLPSMFGANTMVCLQFYLACAKRLLSSVISNVLLLLSVMQLPDRMPIIAKGVFRSSHIALSSTVPSRLTWGEKRSFAVGGEANNP